MNGDSRRAPEIRAGMQDTALAGNGEVSDSYALASMSNYLYGLIMHRSCRLLYSRHAGAPDTSFASGTTHRGRCPEFGLAGKRLCSVTYVDAGVAGSAGFASFTFGGVAQAPPSFAHTAATPGPNSTKVFSFELTGSAPFDFSWSVDANSGINGVRIYQAPANYSSVYSLIARPSRLAAGSPVTYANISDFDTYGYSTVWTYNSTPHFYWSGSAAQTGTTYANILDAATTGYAASAAGFYTIPYRQNSLAATTAQAKFWVYASTSVGTTGRARISNSTGVLATITGIGTAGAYYSTNVNLDTSLTSDLVIVEISDATAGRTITVNGAGLYMQAV